MTRDLHFSDAVHGFGADIFFVGYFALEVPSNLALNRIGAWGQDDVYMEPD